MFNFKKSLLDYGFDKELVKEWMVIRKNKRAINSKFAFNSFIAQVERAGVEKNEVLQLLAERQWAGFNHAWLEELNNSKSKNYNETDRQDSESAKRKEDFYRYAQSVGMVGREENQNIDPIW